MVRDYISLELDVPKDSFDVEITPELDQGLDEEAKAARAAVAAAEQAQQEAAASSRLVARKLKAIGLTGRDIASVLHISAQRVSQLLRS